VLRSVHPDGELAMARACADAGSSQVVSSKAGTRFEDIGSTGPGWWFAGLPAAKPRAGRAVSTASALPRVREAVGESVQVYVDGGICSGLDILTALALGADAAFAGRPPLLALADGDPGVRRWHDELRTELSEAMCPSGATTPRDTLGLSVL
jgi:isopentenyl diphosphate isomerase/L-lactate dehydrogenase-like FMN-dependent dehydrogenase